MALRWRFWRRPGRAAEQRAVSFQDVWGTGADLALPRVASVDTALTLVPVFAATRLLADSVAALPLHTYRQSGETRTRVETPELLADPTEFGTTFDWVHRAMTSLALRGNAYGLITSVDADGNARRVEWLHPDDVTLADNRAVARPRWYWMGRPIPAGRLVHIPGYTLAGEILGLSPIRAYALTTETGLLSQQFGRDWFKRGSVPPAVLETEQQINEQQAAGIKTRFVAAATGREPVALGAGVKYRPIAVPPEESQFLGTMKATVNQIASIYGIPPEMVGGESAGPLVYNSPEQNTIYFNTFSLRPYLSRLEAHLSRLLAEGLQVRFNPDAAIRVDLLSRYQAHQIAIGTGFLTINEVRALEDLPPLTRQPALSKPDDEEGDERDQVVLFRPTRRSEHG